MESKRVYIGGLYYEATEKDLRQLFSKFGEVESIEIKKRLENNVVNFVFAYVNVKTTGPQITQCFKRLNGTFWKGKRLKLELAKESFLAKLQREREQNGQGGWTAPARLLPPPKRQTMQDRILDDVLSTKQRESAEGGPSGVVDFSDETPAAAANVEDVSAPSPKRKKETSEHAPPSPTAAEPEEPPPTRGALSMFGGIGGAAAAAPVPRAAVAAAVPVPVSAAPARRAGSAAAGGAPPASGSDFLSRLEAFSSVWGDDGDGARREPFVPNRRPPERATPAPAPVPAPVPAPAPAAVSPVQPAPVPAAARRNLTVKTAAEDNEKRMASLRQKQEAFQSQKRALQLALSAKADVPRPNKRIVFDASDDDDDEGVTQPASDRPSRPNGRGPSLFGEGEEDAPETDDFRIRPQYEGEKGQKMQALQARFGADNRFTLDERFADEDQQEDREDGQEEDGVLEEHKQQMDILQSVLGTAVTTDTKGKKAKRSSDTGPVRFDPSLESHAQYQLAAKKKPTAAEWPATDTPHTPAPALPPAPVDSGTFYQVAPQLGDLFSRGGQSGGGGGGGFSLLKMMGRAAEDDDNEGGEEEYKTSEIKTKTKHPAIEGAAANPFRYDSSSSEDEAEAGSTGQALGGAAGGGWSQTRKFFMQRDDPRLSEGLEWVRAAPSVEELQQRAEQQRPELLELFKMMRHTKQRVLRRGRGRGRRPPGR